MAPQSTENKKKHIIQSASGFMQLVISLIESFENFLLAFLNAKKKNQDNHV